jgi:hypothetical protein
MSVAFDKRRSKYVVRVSTNGNRIYVGAYDTEEQARAVECRAQPSKLSCYNLDFTEDNVSIGWLKNYRISKALDKFWKLIKK